MPHDKTNLSYDTKTAWITMSMLIEDTHGDPLEVLLLDTWGLGETSIIETLLESLARLSGTWYRRDLLDVGAFT